MTPDVKPGWQTTEFWVTVATAVVMMLVSAGAISQSQASAVPVEWIGGVLGVAIPAAAYAISRGITKHGAATATVLQAVQQANGVYTVPPAPAPAPTSAPPPAVLPPPPPPPV